MDAEDLTFRTMPAQTVGFLPDVVARSKAPLDQDLVWHRVDVVVAALIASKEARTYDRVHP